MSYFFWLSSTGLYISGAIINPPKTYVNMAFRKPFTPKFNAFNLDIPRMLSTALPRVKKFKKINLYLYENFSNMPNFIFVAYGGS